MLLLARRPVARLRSVFALVFLGGPIAVSGADRPPPDTGPSGNHPERIEWFRDLGLGLRVDWSIDSQLGGSMSPALEESSNEIVRRYFDELPQNFHPGDFRPEEWAALAKLAGMRYVIFMAKSSSGFCFFDTETTAFSIMHTPFRRDVADEIVQVFRAQGIAPGFAFATSDLWWSRTRAGNAEPGVSPGHDASLSAHNQAQLRELLTNYGPIDVVRFMGPAAGLRELVWALDAYTIIPRRADGALEEDGAADAAREVTFKLHAQKPLETLFGETLTALIETRARGGNLLLGVEPRANGALPLEQERLLRALARWMFVNRECVHDVRPWPVAHEGGVWFTRSKSGDAVYAIVNDGLPWEAGTSRVFLLTSVRSTESTAASVLGQSNELADPGADGEPAVAFVQEEGGLRIRAMRPTRNLDEPGLPHPVVLKLTGVEPATMTPTE